MDYESLIKLENDKIVQAKARIDELRSEQFNNAIPDILYVIIASAEATRAGYMHYREVIGYYTDRKTAEHYIKDSHIYKRGDYHSYIFKIGVIEKLEFHKSLIPKLNKRPEWPCSD